MEKFSDENLDLFFESINEELERLNSVDLRQQKEIEALAKALSDGTNNSNKRMDDLVEEFDGKLSDLAKAIREEIDSDPIDFDGIINDLSKELRDYVTETDDRIRPMESKLNDLVSSAEAKGGVSKTLRMWSAERVREAAIASLPITATRWPTASEVGLGNVPNVDTRNAANINSGTLKTQRIPVAPNSANPGQGFGGFRYTYANGVLDLYTS